MRLARTMWVFMAVLIVGGTFLIAGAWLYAQSVARGRAHKWEPLTLPVSLHPGIIRTPEIATDRDGEYEIVIKFEKRSGARRVECNLGLEDFYPTYCKGVPNLIDISWKLFEGEKIAAEGDSSSGPSSIDMGSTIERMVGRFRAQNGHRYTLLLDVKQDASELDIANPKIKVEVDRGISKDFAVGTSIERTEAAISGLIGMTILVGAFVFSRLKRR
jgi:hypothetical protein